MSKAPASARSRAPAVDPVLASLLKVQEATLPNGLKVRLLPNRQTPLVSLYLFYRVGSRNERPGITGISHLFEHMMFNGAKRYGPKEFDRVLESRGGRSNAYTSTDLTVYHEDFASDALETVLDLESDRMRSLRISDETLASEREVVKEERRARVDNDIAGLMDEELGTLVYRAHPYRWPVIGWMADIEAISRPDCEQYFRTYYAPNNASLYLVGDFDPREALALVRKYFGAIKPGPEPLPVIDPEPSQKGERRARVHHPAQAPSLMVGYRGPPARDPETLVLDVIQYALTVGEGSRLTRELVYGRELAVHAMMDWTWRIDPGTAIFFLELKPDSRPEQVEQALLAELDRVIADGLSEQELQKAKNNLRAHLLRELSTNAGRAHALGQYEALFGSWRAGLTLPAAYAAITNARVKEVAARYFAPERRSVVTLVPELPSRPGLAA
ncbi:MAG: insulinase family protein [Myxococcaceae bacterium]|nr:insulinase family protein [Myxococcaceae bacterium]MCI0669732.1 insulinase family protein [Myxococcaceae bacterium]